MIYDTKRRQKISLTSPSKHLQNFLNHLIVERGVSRNTLRSYSNDLNSFLKNSPNLKTLADFSSESIRDFLKYLQQSGLSARSIARKLSAIRTFCRFLVEENVMLDDPSEDISIHFSPPRLPKQISLHWVDRIFQCPDISTRDGIRNRTILETLYATGIRVSELTNITIHDLHLTHGFIRCMGKGKKERLIPIGQSAIEWIQRYIRESRQLYIKHHKTTPFLFLNRAGEKMSRITIWTIVRKYALEAGAPMTISPHTIRHTFATHLVMNGADLRSVQEMLGHSSITTTEIYTHLSKEHLKTVVFAHHPRTREKQ